MADQKTPNQQVTALNNLGLTNDNQLCADLSDGIALKDKCEFNKTKLVNITSAQILALNATPVSVIAAPGAGLAILINKVVPRHDTGTAYADIASGDDMVLKYTDASGAECSGQIEATGFMDQTTAQIRSVLGVAVAPVANAAVVLHMLNGEITTGDFDLELLIDYNIVPTDFAA